MKVLWCYLQGCTGQKTTLLSHCSHTASRRVVKPENGERGGGFLSTCEDQLLALCSAVHVLYFLTHSACGWKWSVCFAACNSRAQMLSWPYSAWLPARQKKNTFLATSKSICLPFSSPVPGYTAQTPCSLSMCQSFVWQCETGPLWFPGT